MLVTVGGVAARGYYSYADAFLSKASASNDVASPALTDKQVVKTHFDFKGGGLSLTTRGATGLVPSSTRLNRE